MAKNKFRHFVIDTSVARAAGPPDATSFIPARCFKLLEAVENFRQAIAVFNDELSREWRQHRSKSAAQWHARMLRTRRIRFLDQSEMPNLRDEIIAAGENEDLLPRLIKEIRSMPTEVAEEQVFKMQAAMAKDVHLLEAAAATVGAIFSLDETVRDLFRIAASSQRNPQPHLGKSRDRGGRRY